jgi:hypothetical protein
MIAVNNSSTTQLLYWLLNILSPTINAQAIITYILAEKSKFCKFFIDPFGTGDAGPSFFKAVGNDTMAVNWVILVLHIIICLLLLIAIDTGFLKPSFSFSCLTNPLYFNEATLDDDVLAERRRVLNLNPNTLSIVNNDEGHETDHLIVHDLVKRYPRRSVLAVNHLAFGAKRGEAFGLLGYNVRKTKS